MAASVPRSPAQRFPLPGDKIEVGIPGALDDHQLAGPLQRVLQFMDALAAHIDVVVEGGIRGPGDPTAVIRVDGEVQQEGAGAAFGLGFFADMVYDRHRHGWRTPCQVCGSCRGEAGGLDLLPLCLSRPEAQAVEVPYRYSSTTKLAPRLLTSSLVAPSDVAPAPDGLPVRPAGPPATGPSGPRCRA